MPQNNPKIYCIVDKKTGLYLGSRSNSYGTIYPLIPYGPGIKIYQSVGSARRSLANIKSVVQSAIDYIQRVSMRRNPMSSEIARANSARDLEPMIMEYEVSCIGELK